MAMFYIKLTSLNDFPLEEVPTGQFTESLDSFYVTDSPLSVTNNAQMGKLYLNLPVLVIFQYQLVQLVSLNKVLTVSMVQIVV